MVTLSHYNSNELISINPDSEEGSRIKAELAHQLKVLMDQEQQAAHEGMLRRKLIRETGENLMALTNKKFLSVKNELYIGPDVDNKKIILLTGSKANLPREQMIADGKRTRLRKPRVQRRYSNTQSITSKIGRAVEQSYLNNDPYNIT